MAWIQAKSQARPSQMSWPADGFGLAPDLRSQSQANKIQMNIQVVIYKLFTNILLWHVFQPADHLGP